MSTVEKVASESSEGVLKVRLVLNDVVPSMRDWIRIGNQPKRTPPNTLDLYVLGASNLACRVGFLRVWLNGKLVPEAPTTINAPDSHTRSGGTKMVLEPSRGGLY